jgi:hypothetical protein
VFAQQDQRLAIAVQSLTMQQPYISFVLFSRNDEYTGNILDRLRCSLEILITQLDVHALPAEIVIVDWNFPNDRPRLTEAVKLDRTSPFVSVRFVEVASDRHYRFADADKIPVNIPAAINVGIRRARGTFVVPRASDVFYSEPLIRTIATQALDSSKVYRCTRWDVSEAVLQVTVKEPADLLERCEPNVQHVHTMLAVSSYPPAPALHTNASGDFILASRRAWHRIGGVLEGRSVISMDHDGLALHALVTSGLEECTLPEDCRVYKLAHGTHTYTKIAEAPLPQSVKTVEEGLIKEIPRLVREAGYQNPPNFADFARFWIRLVLGLPRRELRGVGVVGHPTYLEYLFRITRMSRMSFWPYLDFNWNWLWQARNRALLKHCIKVTFSLCKQSAQRDPDTWRLIPMMLRVCRLLRLALNRKPYRMNGKLWGLAIYRLNETVVTGERL